MPKATTTPAVQKVKADLAKANAALKSEKAKLAKLKAEMQASFLMAMEEAYAEGYTTALVDIDKKAEALERALEKTAEKFEKEYAAQTRKATKAKMKKKA